MKDIEQEYLLKNVNVKSVFHIGAYDGSEIDFYIQMGIKNIIFAEPNPELYDLLTKRCSDEKYKDMNLILSDCAIYNTTGDILDFNLYYDNKRQNKGCSSIRESVLHNQMYPQILYNGTIQVNTATADFIAKSELVNFDVEFLNIDVQGVEYEVFLGAHEILSTTVKVILVETADVELYKNQKYQKDITELLSKYGFVLDRYFAHDTTWGDTIYIKK